MQDSISIKAVRLAFTGVGAVLPEPMAALAERLYFAARRHPAPEREQAILDEGVAFTVETELGPLAASRWEPVLPWERSDRGTVLLVHGWEGRASQLGAFVAPLVARGFTVVGADAPGHGRSAGVAVDLPTYAGLLGDVAAAAASDGPPVRAVIAHSFGAGAVTLALAAADGRFDVDAAVLVAPPCSFGRYVESFGRTFGLTRATEAIFRSRLEHRLGRRWERDLALDLRAQGIDVPALIQHDTDDAEIPFAEGAALANSWAASTLVATGGLGHRRILRDDSVIERAVDFIDARAAAAS